MMTAQELLMILGVPSIICVIFSSIWTLILSRLKHKKEEEITQEKKRDADTALLKRASQAMLQSQLYDMGHRLVNVQGYASLLEKQCYSKMYECYRELGCDGSMEELYKTVMALPITKPKAPIRKKAIASDA